MSKAVGSKFAGLMSAIKDRGEEPEEATAFSDSKPALENNAEGARRGRPPAKRSSRDFTQVTAYIRRETHRRVKMALLSEGEEQEFSELVETLLADWLTART